MATVLTYLQHTDEWEELHLCLICSELTRLMPSQLLFFPPTFIAADSDSDFTLLSSVLTFCYQIFILLLHLFMP